MAAKKEFSLEESKVAQELNSLTNEEIVDRYFVKGSYGKEKGFLEEMEQGINLKTPDTNVPKFPLAKSIAGPNLNYFFSTISDTVAGYWVVEGYKLNVERIWQDFEDVLKEYRRETAAVSANRETMSQFIQKISNFFNYLLLTRAYLKEDGTTFGV